MLYSITEAFGNPEVDDRLRVVTGMAVMDRKYREEFLADPVKALDDVGLSVPEGVELVVLETPPGAQGLALFPLMSETQPLIGKDLFTDSTMQFRLKTAIGLATFNKEYRAKLIEDPAAALAMVGLTIPEGIKLFIHDTPPDKLGFTLPAPDYVEMPETQHGGTPTRS